MRRRRPIRLLIVVLAFLSALVPRPTEGANPRDDLRAAFQDARFGLFLPWGVYSLLGKGAWVMERDRLPVSEYEKLPPRFNPAEFDAEAWVKTARDAGARYLVLAAKHHDGFCMFESGLTRYDVVDATPFGRDPLRALADACRKHGILPVVYYSMLDWHHPDYAPRGRTGKASGRDDKGDWSKYLAYAQGQIRELCTNYGPIGGVWLDGVWDKPEAPWDLETTYALIHRLQPSALVANREALRSRPGEDVQAFDRDLGASADPALAWEVCRDGDSNWSGRDLGSTDDLIRTIVDLAARGANLRLGIAPRAEGTIPVAVAGRLADLGRWLDRHGASIYGTLPGPLAPQDWGVSTRDREKQNAGRPSAIYLHVLKPVRQIRLPAPSRPIEARLMGRADRLVQIREGQDLIIRLPEPEKSEEAIDRVIVIRPKGPDR